MSDPIKVRPVSIGPEDYKAERRFSPADIGRFGFKNSQDMENFLRSDTGHIVQSIMMNEAMQERESERRQHLSLLEHLRRNQLRLAILFGALIHKKEAHADLIRAINEQIKHTRDMARNAKNNLSADHDAVVKSYRESIDAVTKVIAEKTQDAEEMEKIIDQLLLDKEALQNKHQIFDDHIDQVYTIKDSEELEKFIAEATGLLEDYMNEIHQWLAEDRPEEARELLLKHNAVMAQRANAQQTLDALNHPTGPAAKVRYYDDEGQNTNDPAKIAYILSKTLKMELRRHDNNFYLVPEGKLAPDQSVDKLNHDEKNAAKQAFEQHKPTIMSVRATVTDIKTKEIARFEARIKPVLTDAKKTQNEILFLENKKAEIQSDMASLESLQRPKSTAPSPGMTPKPTPRPQPGNNRIAENNPNPTSSYRLIIHTLKVNQLMQLDEGTRKQLTNDIKNLCPEAMKREVPKLKAGQTITKEQQERIIALISNSSGSLTEITKDNFPSTAPAPKPMSNSPFNNR